MSIQNLPDARMHVVLIMVHIVLDAHKWAAFLDASIALLAAETRSRVLSRHLLTSASSKNFRLATMSLATAAPSSFNCLQQRGFQSTSNSLS
eukprot:702642-Amphidinium_carterae.1